MVEWLATVDSLEGSGPSQKNEPRPRLRVQKSSRRHPPPTPVLVVEALEADQTRHLHLLRLDSHSVWTPKLALQLLIVADHSSLK